jgi:PAS domain S-box-containing protein
VDRIHPDDRPKFLEAIGGLTPANPTSEVTYRARSSDSTLVWLKSNGRGFFDAEGRLLRVVGMVADITDIKRAEEALRISEERLRLAQWAAHIGTFDLNLRTGVDIWPPETEALYGLPPGSFGGTLTAFEGLIHPKDRERVQELTREMAKTGDPAEAEWRVVWPDGSVHWIASRGQVFMDESGEPSRMLGVNMDITERKRAEEALSGMTRKLIDAQEQERARIGRELHDDINQRFALFAFELEQLKDNTSEIEILVQTLQQRISEIADDVQALSHELHSSKLEYLGVVAGIKSWCKEFGERQKMEIQFSSDVFNTLPKEIGLTLLRVLQEALHNALKHSGVRKVEVQLRYVSDEIHLVVRDGGRGFETEAALQGKGLGLTSMRERVRLVNGTIAIDSRPMGGTTIHVRVPLESKHDSQRAAG